MSSDVRIGDFKFRGIHAVEIRSSWDLLTDTAKITVPRKTEWKGRQLATGADPLIKRLDPVSIALGYNGQPTTRFQGFVRLASSDTPTVIQCEDAMFLLKQNPQTIAIKKCTLSKLMNAILPGGIKVNVVADYELGTIRISRLTPAQVLKQLRQKFGVRAWMRDGELYVGAAYVPSLQKRRKIHFESMVASHSLQYRRKEDLRFKLKATIIYPDNTKKEVEKGDSDGDTRSFHYYNISTAAANKLLDAELERLLVEGYSGGLTIFGVPHFLHGDVAELRSDLLPERDGDYLVEEVVTSFGPQGFRQTLKIDTKV